jgi:hypothetical protein
MIRSLKWAVLPATLIVLLSWSCASSETESVAPTTGPGSGGAGGSGGATGGSATGGDQGPCADVTCPDGEICQNGECKPGCATQQDCQAGLRCCSGACVDVANDVIHCGDCDQSCGTPPNLTMTCDAGLCYPGQCDPGFVDCNGMTDDGCETMGMCSCTPGAQQDCYPGPPNTEGVGSCKKGYQVCNQTGTAWSLCFDYQGPTKEICSNNIDEDCTGMADDVPDLDSDGWTVCDGDCCETTQDCSIPALVNPGAFEVVGNMVDDDCDQGSSDSTPPPACSTAPSFGSVTPTQMAEAMDLCQFTTANAPLPQKKWGVINAEFRLANGNVPTSGQLSNIQSWQSAVLANYGTGGVVPRTGPTMAGISTGRMRDANDPGYIEPNTGTEFNVQSQPPAAYLAQHGNSLPTQQGCMGQCNAGTGANDPVNLRLEIRVPTNALSFSYDFRFFSAEFRQYACTAFNDFYLALLTTGAAIPADKNISFDNFSNPVSVNNAFFEFCESRDCYTCPQGTGPLVGTGLDELVSKGPPGPPLGPGMTGGGTTWLATTAPVISGETITLELMLFDVSDYQLDSIAILDAFEWSVQSSGVGTGPAG